MEHNHLYMEHKLSKNLEHCSKVKSIIGTDKPNHENLIVGSFYCPPISSLLVIDNLSLNIANIKQNYPHYNIILHGGDFNCPGIDWEHGILMESYMSQLFNEKFLKVIQSTQMEQFVTFPT